MLIELLVVIAIIAILLDFCFPLSTVSRIRQNERRPKTI